jgi:hypothetical protein
MAILWATSSVAVQEVSHVLDGRAERETVSVLPSRLLGPLVLAQMDRSFRICSRLAGERRAVLLHNGQPTVRVLAVLSGDL